MRGRTDAHVQADAAPAGAPRRRQARALRPPGRGAARPHRGGHRRDDRAPAHGLHRRRHRRRGHRLGHHAERTTTCATPAARRQRVTKFVDFVGATTAPTTTGATARTWPASSPATATTSHGARTGIAPEANTRRAQGARRRGPGPHQLRSSRRSTGSWPTASPTTSASSTCRSAPACSSRYNTDPLTLAAKRAVDAGIVVVAAAGNIGKNADGQPQYGAITRARQRAVGAHGGRRRHARAPSTAATTRWRSTARAGRRCIDFARQARPGRARHRHRVAGEPEQQDVRREGAVPAATARGYTAYKPYLTLSGTSMAAPVVAGTVALMLQANPNLTPNLVKAILQYTAEVDAELRRPHAGRRLPQRARRGHAGRVLRGRPSPAAAIRWRRTWSKHILWGNRRVTGGVLTPGGNAWGANIVWGEARARRPEHRLGRELRRLLQQRRSGATTSCGGSTTTSSGATNIVWGLDDNIVWGLARRQHRVGPRRQHRLGPATTTSCGASTAAAPTATTSCGATTPAHSGSNIVWGLAEGLNVVWGNNIVWGLNIVWGESTDPDASWGSSGTDGLRLRRRDARKCSSLRPARCGTSRTTPSCAVTSRSPVATGGSLLMEKMPFSEALPRHAAGHGVPGRARHHARPTGAGSCRCSRPARVTLRALRADDAALAAARCSPPRKWRASSRRRRRTVEGFERFIAWAQREQAAGPLRLLRGGAGRHRHRGGHLPGALSSTPAFDTAEWGFVMGSAFWGTGLFADGAHAGRRLRVRRDRRAPPRSARGGANGRGNGALRQDRRGARSACCASRSTVTASATTSTCGRFWPTTGGPRAPSATRACTKSQPASSGAQSGRAAICSTAVSVVVRMLSILARHG